MINLQFRSLVHFADALGYSCIKNPQSGKPYFINKIGWTPKTLDITQMQYLHNMSFFTVLDMDAKLKIILRSSGKKDVTFWCYRCMLSNAALHKECDTVHLLWNKKLKQLVLNK